MFLTRTEIFELTGYKRGTAQARWLRAEGFSFRIGADGRPRVLRAAVEKALGLGRADTARPARRREPDFSRI